MNNEKEDGPEVKMMKILLETKESGGEKAMYELAVRFSRKQIKLARVASRFEVDE